MVYTPLSLASIREISLWNKIFPYSCENNLPFDAVIILHFLKHLKDGKMLNVMEKKEPSVGKISCLL